MCGLETLSQQYLDNTIQNSPLNLRVIPAISDGF